MAKVDFTSYYAVFHALTTAASAVLFRDELTQLASLRWFDHAAIRRVSSAISAAPADEVDSKLVRWVSEVGGKYGFTTRPEHRVQIVCQSFVDLYKRREQADYYRSGEIDTSESSARDSLASGQRCCEMIADLNDSTDFYLVATECSVNL